MTRPPMDDTSLQAARRFVASLGLPRAADDEPCTQAEVDAALQSALVAVRRCHALLVAAQAERHRLTRQIGMLRDKLQAAETEIARRRDGA